MNRTLRLIGNEREELETLLGTNKSKNHTYQSFEDLDNTPLNVARMLQVRRDFEVGQESIFPEAPDKFPKSVYGRIIAFFDEASFQTCAEVSSGMRGMLSFRGEEGVDAYQVDPGRVVASMQISAGECPGVMGASFEDTLRSSEDIFLLSEPFVTEHPSVDMGIQDETCLQEEAAPSNHAMLGVLVVLVIVDLLIIVAVQQWQLKVAVFALSIAGVAGAVYYQKLMASPSPSDVHIFTDMVQHPLSSAEEKV